MSIHPTAVIYPGVTIGSAVLIAEFCIIGCPPEGRGAGELETVIGDGAVIRSHTVIYAGNRIGSGFRTGNKANIRESNTIGDNVSVGTLSVIEHHVTIGAGARIHSQAFVPEYSILKAGCWVGPNVVLTNARYPGSPGAKRNLVGPVLEERCRVGANATILPGVTIGREAVVGAGSVVTRDVPPGEVVAGNPARRLKSVSDLPYGAAE